MIRASFAIPAFSGKISPAPPLIRMGSQHLTFGGASAPFTDQAVPDGTSVFRPSDLITSAADHSRPARIFIVEDDPVMLRVIAEYLEQHNMHAVPASGLRGGRK
jgi:hypothetical protein